LAVTDLRRGVLVKSEDQEEELLSSVFVGGLPSKPGRSKGEKVLVGSSNGVLTLWERGVWDDQDERIIVDGGRGGGESLDSLVVMPEDVGDGGKNVVVGVGDGTIRIVKLGPNKLIGEPLRHDEVEAVVGLGFDVGGRLISGGGSIVKVWQEKMNLDDDDESEDETVAKRGYWMEVTVMTAILRMLQTAVTKKGVKNAARSAGKSRGRRILGTESLDSKA
jgi:hypothetical protein